MKKDFLLKDFIIVVLITSVWVNLSEVLRYFFIVIPEVKTYLSVVPEVAEVNIGILIIWGLWDTLLTALIVFIFWLYAQKFGNSIKSVVAAGIISWCFFFVLFWVGLANMGLSSWQFLLIVLPLALLETLVASLIASYVYQWQNKSSS